MRQFAPRGSVHPGAEDSAEEGDTNDQEAAADLGVQRTRTGAGDTPAKAEDESADDVAPAELFFGDGNLLAANGFYFETFDEYYRYHAYRYSAAYDTIHVKALQAEHLLYAEPRYNLGFYQDNAKYDAYKQKFYVLHVVTV